MKTIKVQVLPDPVQGPGYAIMILEGSAIELASNLSFSIARNQDGRFLARDGQWQPTETWLEPQEQQVEGALVRCWVGSEVVDALLANPQMQYRILVKAAEQSFQGIMRLSSGLFPSSARAVAVAPAVQAAPQPEQDVVAAEPVNVDPPPPPPLPAAKKNIMVPVLLGLLALALVGGALWWLLGKGDSPSMVEVQTTEQAVVAQEPAPKEDPEPPAPEPQEPAPEQAAVDVVAEPAPPPVPCSVQALAESKDDLAYLQLCVQTRPSTEEIFAVIEAGKAAQKCDLIQRLYAHAAQTGNAAVALAYAKEFDPLTFAGGCFAAPEAETAAYWYEIYLQQNPDDQAVATRVRSLKE